MKATDPWSGKNKVVEGMAILDVVLLGMRLKVVMVAGPSLATGVVAYLTDVRLKDTSAVDLKKNDSYMVHATSVGVASASASSTSGLGAC